MLRTDAGRSGSAAMAEWETLPLEKLYDMLDIGTFKLYEGGNRKLSMVAAFYDPGQGAPFRSV